MTDEIIFSMNEQVLNHFGGDHQLHKLEEELAELLLVAKRVRSGEVKLTSYQFVEEIADVENVLCQIKIELQREYIASGESDMNVDLELNRIKTKKLKKVICVERIDQ